MIGKGKGKTKKTLCTMQHACDGLEGVDEVIASLQGVR